MDILLKIHIESAYPINSYDSGEVVGESKRILPSMQTNEIGIVIKKWKQAA